MSRILIATSFCLFRLFHLISVCLIDAAPINSDIVVSYDDTLSSALDGHDLVIKRRQHQKRETERLLKDDIEYWDRFIAGTLRSVQSPAPTSKPPTPNPTQQLQELFDFCETQAAVTCVRVNEDGGMPCADLIAPRGECETGSNLNTVRFQLEYRTCKDSSNTQEDFLTTCTDLAPLPSSDGEEVRTTCLNVDDNTLLYSDTNQVGEEISIVLGRNGDSFPHEINCSLFSVMGDLLQTVTIKTSDGDDLYLKDNFGSLTVVGCNSQQCMVDLIYTYTVRNTGTTSVTVTRFERTRNGDKENLLPQQTPFDIAPGDSASVDESETLDLCIGADYLTTTEVIAIPPNGEECPNEASYFITVLDGCLLKVQITCKTEDGVNCADIEARDENCSMEVVYEYELSNVGTGEMDITTLVRTRKYETESLIGLLPVTKLQPGESTRVVERETINICEPTEYHTDVLAEGDPPNGQQCFDDDMYKFSLSPVCKVSTEMSCATVGGVDCQEIKAEESIQCTCPAACVTTLVYRYTAASCAAGLQGCADSGTNEPTADIVAVNGNSILFEGRVQIEDDVIIRAGPSIDCIPATLQVLVSPAGEQAATQVVLIDSSCGGTGASLLDNFGALEFIGYTCGDGNSHSCFLDIEYSIATTNTGTVPQTVTDWTFELNEELRNAGVELPVLEPQGGFTRIEAAEVAVCSEGEYVATARVTSTGLDDNRECGDTDNIIFRVDPPPSPAVDSLPPIPVEPPIPEDCTFEMSIECVPPPGVASCNATPPPVEQCSGRPFKMGFLYNGGDCSNSWNVQEAAGKFFCNDFNGAPPTTRGEKSFIIVTDLKGETIFHNDFVTVGSIFTLFDGGEDFPSDQLITIYSRNDTEDLSTILQSMQYHSSCSSNLFLKDRFGAVQLVLWENEDQGVVSCFANQTFNLEVSIPIDIEGGPATITGLTVSSNVDPFFFNLTDRVAGIEADGGEIIKTAITLPIDLTLRRTYNMVMTLTSETAGGETCIATNLLKFSAGYPLEPIFPTFSPTMAPDT